MAIVNFSIEKTLDERLKRAIKARGFSSRAEYFRTCIIRDLDEWEMGKSFAMKRHLESR